MTIPEPNAIPVPDAQPIRTFTTFTCDVQTVGRLPHDDGGLLIRLPADGLPPEFVSLPLGTVLRVTVGVSVPPFVIEVDEVMKERARAYYGEELSYDDQAHP